MNSYLASAPKISLVLVLAFCAACTHLPPAGSIASAPVAAVGEDADPRSSVMRTANAIAQGEAALRSDQADSLMRAAQILAAVGARPADSNADNLADTWAQIASRQNPQLVAPIYRGRLLGPAYKSGTITGNGSIVIEQLFLAGKKATVALVPAAASKLTIHVKNGNGEPICVKPKVKEKASCQWLPVFTDRFEIRVQNQSQTSVKYHLVLN
ncbi:hypothetical protein [Parasphingorhabdus sp.]|jgi:hypothetical protein|uniref:hypothetical protein n=1 Tax=Parasphingorhabdus sp. TaxID=2709688 RepID=UPI003D28E1AA